MEIRSSEKYEQLYKRGELIGSGGFAKVYEVRLKADPEKVSAVKIISKEELSEDDYYYVLSEIEILTQVDHPNIVRLIEIFDDDNNLYLVFELMRGGDVI
jgi:calcium/calmodulin-dependent protein kinase I